MTRKAVLKACDGTSMVSRIRKLERYLQCFLQGNMSALELSAKAEEVLHRIAEHCYVEIIDDGKSVYQPTVMEHRVNDVSFREAL